MTTPTQLAFPGMAPPPPPVKPRRLADLYWAAYGAYWAPHMDRIATELAARGALGPHGLTEEDLAEVPLFMSLAEFQADLDAKGVPYRL